MIGTFKDLGLTFDGQCVLTLVTKTDCRLLWEELGGAEVAIEIKRPRKGRSLDANAYFWTLAGRLAEKLRLPKEEIYRGYIREIGGVSETVCVQEEAAAKLCGVWRSRGLGWQAETFPSKIEGCVNIILYYGSSTYDTAQMSRLIDLAVQDCREQGIETATPEELTRLTALWGQ